MQVWVERAGIVGPGLPGWDLARPLLAGESPVTASELLLPKLDLLPPVERRRTGTLVKLALAAGQDALGQSRAERPHLPTVFASSGGDGDVINEICITLATSDRQVSPTRFHNSVHNAPAGYWSIATGSRAPSTSLAAFDWSFAAGLIEAATQIVCGQDQVLLIAADMGYPQPLLGVRGVKLGFGGALLLTRKRGGQSLAALALSLGGPAQPTPMREPTLEQLRENNPSARGLPVFAALAGGTTTTVALDYVAGKSLSIVVSPC